MSSRSLPRAHVADHDALGPPFNPDKVIIEPYCDVDWRTGWKDVHIVLIEGWGPVGFCVREKGMPETNDEAREARALRLLRIDAINACGLAKPSRYTQNELLEQIERFVARHGHEPTTAEIRAIAQGDLDPAP